MKKTIKIVSLVLVLTLVCTCFLFACKEEEPESCEHQFDNKGVCTLCGEKKCDIEGHTWHNGVCVYDETKATGLVDYVDQLRFDENANRKHATVSVRNYVDGDTTHFNISTQEIDTGILKARYLAVNTPESTGTVEPYGKVASNFTKERLSAATSIILESDSATWDKDSTGTRYTVWIWYKRASDENYRNLNLELLQEGLGRASNAEGNSYGETCMNAIRQAQQYNFRVHDDSVKDETFYYGDAQPMTMKELRSNIKDYVGEKVAVDGVVVLDNNNGVYVEDYDDNDDISYGIYAYYGFTRNSDLKDILSVGNYVRVVGTVTEFNGTYQVSGLDHRVLYPDDPNNTVLLDEENKYDPQWKEMTVAEFYAKRTVTIIGGDSTEDQEVTDDYAAFAQATSIYMTNLIVDSIYTTKTPGSDSRGAMSITCHQAGSTTKIVIRTGVLKDPDGKYGVPPEFIAPKPANNTAPLEGAVLQGYFVGKTFNVKGVVGYYSNEDGEKYGNSPYQINVFSLANIEFVA